MVAYDKAGLRKNMILSAGLGRNEPEEEGKEEEGEEVGGWADLQACWMVVGVLGRNNLSTKS